MKTGLSGADIVIGTSHALEDFGFNDVVCGSLNIIAKNMFHFGALQLL